MEYGPHYSITQMAQASEKILSLIDKINFGFFSDRNVPFDRREILCSISVAKNLKAINNRFPVVSHPALHAAIKRIETIQEEEIKDQKSEHSKVTSTLLYMDLVWLTDSMINIIVDTYEKSIEKLISDKRNSEAVKLLTLERQADKFNRTHPTKFITKYHEFLNKRIRDIKEMIELDKLDFGTELKEIIESYKLGLEVNVKGRNLLTPLLARDYDFLVENIKNSLFVPSYHDIPKNEKEKYFHVYLLGILEGRLNLYNLKSNKESGFGRYDICAFPINKKHPGLLIEIKSDTTKVNTALEQIESNKYENELRIEGVKEVLALAINFQHKKILTEYRVIKLD